MVNCHVEQEHHLQLISSRAMLNYQRIIVWFLIQLVCAPPAYHELQGFGWFLQHGRGCPLDYWDIWVGMDKNDDQALDLRNPDSRETHVFIWCHALLGKVTCAALYTVDLMMSGVLFLCVSKVWTIRHCSSFWCLMLLIHLKERTVSISWKWTSGRFVEVRSSRVNMTLMMMMMMMMMMIFFEHVRNRLSSTPKTNHARGGPSRESPPTEKETTKKKSTTRT